MSAIRYATISLSAGLMLAAFALLFEGLPAHATSFDVCASGCHFSTIQSAVNATDSGGTITIAPGVYNETVTIARPVTILGPQHGISASRTTPDAAEAIVTGFADGDGNQRSFIVDGPHVTIDGLTLGPVSYASNNAFTGVYFTNGSSNDSVVSTILRNNNFGIEAHWTDGLAIDNDRFDNNFIGLYEAHVDNATVGTNATVLFTGANSMHGAIFEWGTHLKLGALAMTGIGSQVSFTTDDDVTFNGVTQAHATDGIFAVAAPASTPVTTTQPVTTAATTTAGVPGGTGQGAVTPLSTTVSVASTSTAATTTPTMQSMVNPAIAVLPATGSAAVGSVLTLLGTTGFGILMLGMWLVTKQ